MPPLRLSLLPLLLASNVLGAEPAPSVVQVGRPRRGEITRFISLPGTLVANQQATLEAKVAGFLKKIAVDKGSRVQAGDLIAELEVPELLAEQAHDQAQLDLTRLESGRLEGARKTAPDLVTPTVVDEAVGKLKMAEANLARTESLLAYATVRAPFAGIVTMRFVDPGAFIPAAHGGGNASALVTLMDFSVVRAQVEIPEAEASLAAPGEPVKVSVTSLPGRVFSSQVSRSSYAIDPATRSLLVEADLPNADLALRPGMYAMVEVGVEKHARALLIPTTALIREKANLFVFTVANGQVARTQIKPGFADSQNVEVLAGIDPDTAVVLNGRLPLVAGQRVTPVASP